MADAKVALDQVTLRYQRPGDGGSSLAVDGVSLRVAQGEFLAIVGPSGCGKSTLLRIVAGLLSASSGSVTVDGAPVRRVRGAAASRRRCRARPTQGRRALSL